MVACARKKKRRSARNKIVRAVQAPHNNENITLGLQMLRDANFPTGPVALDCEMVGVGADRRSALARASIVAYDGTVLYDVVCRPEDPITDYRTKYSGIRPSDMLRAIPFASVQEQVQRIIKGRIVVGHGLANDFKVLQLVHPNALIRDTSKSSYAKTKALLHPSAPVSLRYLAFVLLGVKIQAGEHSSVEDAQANMTIYKLVEAEWEAGIARSTGGCAKQRRKRSENDATSCGMPDLALLTNDAFWEAVNCDNNS